MLWRARIPAALVAMALATACTRPPELPELPGNFEAEPRRVVLDSELSVADFRELFQAINRSGKLDALRPWLDSDTATLSAIVELFDRYLYREAFRGDALVALLEARLYRNEMGQLTRWVEGLGPYGAALRGALLHPLTPDLAERDAFLLTENWQGILSDFRKAMANFPDQVGREPGASEPLAGSWLRDLRTFLNAQGERENLARLLEVWRRQRFPDTALAGLARMGEERGPKLFEGLGQTLARMASAPVTGGNSPSRLQSLLELLELLNQPTAGLFSRLQEKLAREPDAVRELARFLGPMIPRAVTGYLRETLQSPPAPLTFDREFWLRLASRPTARPLSEEWIQLFTAVRSAVEKVTGPSAGGFEPQMFLKNLPIYTNAYALTWWIDTVVRENRETLETLDPNHFSRLLWSTPVAASPVTVDLAEQNEQGDWTLSPAAREDFLALGMSEFAEELAVVLPRQGFGEFFYEFPEGNAPLAETLPKVVGETHRSRPYGEPEALLLAAAYGVTRPNGGSGFQLADLESPNLLATLNRLLSAVTPETWEQIRRWLFEDLKIGRLGSEERTLILSLYEEHPEIQQRVGAILDRMELIPEFDTGDRGLPSGFALYHALVREIPSNAQQALTETLAWLQSSGLFSTRTPTVYPALWEMLKRGAGVAELLHGLSEVGASHYYPALEGFWRLVGTDLTGNSGLHAHWSWLRDNLNGAPEPWQQLATDWERETFPTLALSREERLWLVRFAAEGGFRQLWGVLAQSRRAEGLRLVRELRSLSAAGYLGEAFAMLGLVRNDRMERVAATLSRWEKSGELVPLLEAFAHWMEP